MVLKLPGWWTSHDNSDPSGRMTLAQRAVIGLLYVLAITGLWVSLREVVEFIEVTVAAVAVAHEEYQLSAVAHALHLGSPLANSLPWLVTATVVLLLVSESLVHRNPSWSEFPRVIPSSFAISMALGAGLLLAIWLCDLTAFSGNQGDIRLPDGELYARFTLACACGSVLCAWYSSQRLCAWVFPMVPAALLIAGIPVARQTLRVLWDSYPATTVILGGVGGGFVGCFLLVWAVRRVGLQREALHIVPFAVGIWVYAFFARLCIESDSAGYCRWCSIQHHDFGLAVLVEGWTTAGFVTIWGVIFAFQVCRLARGWFDGARPGRGGRNSTRPGVLLPIAAVAVLLATAWLPTNFERPIAIDSARVVHPYAPFNLDRIRLGMTADQVGTILGRPEFTGDDGSMVYGKSPRTRIFIGTDGLVTRVAGVALRQGGRWVLHTGRDMGYTVRKLGTPVARYAHVQEFHVGPTRILVRFVSCALDDARTSVTVDWISIDRLSAPRVGPDDLGEEPFSP